MRSPPHSLVNPAPFLEENMGSESRGGAWGGEEGIERRGSGGWTKIERERGEGQRASNKYLAAQLSDVRVYSFDRGGKGGRKGEGKEEEISGRLAFFPSLSLLLTTRSAVLRTLVRNLEQGRIASLSLLKEKVDGSLGSPPLSHHLLNPRSSSLLKSDRLCVRIQSRPRPMTNSRERGMASS